MRRFHIQEKVEEIKFNEMPIQWRTLDLGKFSKKKSLFEFQRAALRSGLKALHLYFRKKRADREALLQCLGLTGWEEELVFDLRKKQEARAARYLLEYPDDFPVRDGKISFSAFLNRMSFWMATGSGKTLIIIKLIEFLGRLIGKRDLPPGDILFLAHRDDLLDQFRNHVEEFNAWNVEGRIRLENLRDYESVKRDNVLPFEKNEVTVFYYRSDLISDERKEKIVDFRDYDNGGRWYVFLDEAHKGDREESKRQILYSILSRNRFLFNFSATFTDPRDFATCVFNFNLSRFVEEGYGKHVGVSSAGIKMFRGEDEFSALEKQRVVLKTLLLLASLRKRYEEIGRIDSSLYHRPLLLTLVNSVDVERSDLELFFRELEKVARGEIRIDLLRRAKEELLAEFGGARKFLFEKRESGIDEGLVSGLGYADLLKYVFNARTPGRFEVLKIPDNRREMILRLMTTEKPFALIKIGDISGWLAEKLEGYEINEGFANESVFRRINRNDSEINVLMGSRAFYEGWDSNRPNVILFINIGVGRDAEKFVLQSVGRGIRIEPKENRRRRLAKLLEAAQIKPAIFKRIEKLVLPLESLFVFGTNAENIREIIATLKAEEEGGGTVPSGRSFREGKEGETASGDGAFKRGAAEENIREKLALSYADLEMSSRYLEYLGDKITVVKYGCGVENLTAVKESFRNPERYYDLEEGAPLWQPDTLLGVILSRFSS